MRPPSIPDLHRRSGRIPGQSYPPSKQIGLWPAGADSRSGKRPFWNTKALNPQGVWGQSPPSRGRSVPSEFVREQVGRRLIAERLMRSLVVVEVEVVLQRREQIEAAGEVAGIDQLVLERAPQPFDENVVERTAAAIHADQDAALLERSQEVGRGELRALIGVPDFGLAGSGRLLASSAARQKLVSIVLDSSQLSTNRLNQSITATRYRKPPRIGMWVISVLQHVEGPLDRNAA